LATVVLAAPELLDDDLLVAELPHDLADDAGAGDRRGADGGAVGAGDEEDLVEDDLAAGVAGQAVEGDDVPLADAELVAAVLEDGVHRSGDSHGPGRFVFGVGRARRKMDRSPTAEAPVAAEGSYLSNRGRPGEGGRDRRFGDFVHGTGWLVETPPSDSL